MEGTRREIQGALREAAREARSEQTPAEKALWAMVRNHRCGGLHFSRQKRFGTFRVDFYCPALSLAVEVDGGVHNEPNVKRRDEERQAILEQEFGLRFLRVTNDDVLKHPHRVRRYLLGFLDAAPGQCQKEPEP